MLPGLLSTLVDLIRRFKELISVVLTEMPENFSSEILQRMTCLSKQRGNWIFIYWKCLAMVCKQLLSYYYSIVCFCFGLFLIVIFQGVFFVCSYLLVEFVPRVLSLRVKIAVKLLCALCQAFFPSLNDKRWR